MTDKLEVEVSEAANVDWSRHVFPLGVKLPGGDTPCLQLDREDLAILHSILTRRLITKTNSGHICDTPAAAEGSEALAKLAMWAEAAALWMARKGY